MPRGPLCTCCLTDYLHHFVNHLVNPLFGKHVRRYQIHRLLIADSAALLGAWKKTRELSTRNLFVVSGGYYLVSTITNNICITTTTTATTTSSTSTSIIPSLSRTHPREWQLKGSAPNRFLPRDSPLASNSDQRFRSFFFYCGKPLLFQHPILSYDFA